MMMFWLPRLLIRSWASKLAPSPMASTVSKDRSRCSQRLLTPSRMVRLSCARESPRSKTTGMRVGLSAGIAFDLAVAQPDGAARVVGHVGVVGDQDEGFALRVECV